MSVAIFEMGSGRCDEGKVALRSLLFGQGFLGGGDSRLRFLLKITALRFLGHSFFVFYVFGLTWNVFLHFFVSRCLRTRL